MEWALEFANLCLQNQETFPEKCVSLFSLNKKTMLIKYVSAMTEGALMARQNHLNTSVLNSTVCKEI